MQVIKVFGGVSKAAKNIGEHARKGVQIGMLGLAAMTQPAMAMAPALTHDMAKFSPDAIAASKSLEKRIMPKAGEVLQEADKHNVGFLAAAQALEKADPFAKSWIKDYASLEYRDFLASGPNKGKMIFMYKFNDPQYVKKIKAWSDLDLSKAKEARISCIKGLNDNNFCALLKIDNFPSKGNNGEFAYNTNFYGAKDHIMLTKTRVDDSDVTGYYYYENNSLVAVSKQQYFNAKIDPNYRKMYIKSSTDYRGEDISADYYNQKVNEFRTEYDAFFNNDLMGRSASATVAKATSFGLD